METAQFLEFLERSGLLTFDRLDAIRAEAEKFGAADAEALAHGLVQSRVLTPFQAERLLRGKWRNFIINEKFRVLDRWDAGDLGIFFRCEHLTLRRNVTLRSHSAMVEEAEGEVKPLFDRIRLISQVSDPHLGRVIDIERVNGQPLLVMEDLKGPSLEELIFMQGPQPIEQAASFITQAALGLQTLHEAGYLHGEVRPARMVFDPSNQLKLLDAGLGEWFGNPRLGSRSKSRTGDKGFPLWDYAAPETLMNRPDVDARADLYSLGCTLHHLLTGQPPFAAFAPTDKLKAHQFAEPPNLEATRQDIPPAMRNLTRQLLAKKPEQRPDAAIDVANALLPWAGGALPPVTQAMLGLASYSSDMPPEVEARRRASPSVRKKSGGAGGGSSSRRRKIATAAAAVITVLAIAAALIALMSALQGMSYAERKEKIVKALADGDTETAMGLFVEGLQKTGAKQQLDRTQLLNLLAQIPRDDLLPGVAARLPKDGDVQIRLADSIFKKKDYPAASAAYGAAAAVAPEKPEVWEKWSESLVREGRWAEAAEKLGKVEALKADDSHMSVRRAMALAMAGDWPGYRAQIAAMWAKFKSSRNPADVMNVAYAAALAPDPPPAELKDILAGARASISKLPGLGWPRLALGAVLYRTGQPAEAIQELRLAQGEASRWDGKPIGLPFLSLAHLRAEHRPEAEQAYREAAEWETATRAKAKTPAGQYAPLLANWWDSACFDAAFAEARKALGSP